MTATQKRRMAFLVLVLISFALLFTGCKDENGPEETIKKFTKAYNKADINAMLDCIDPTQAEAMRSVLNIAAGIAGVGFSGEDLLGALPLFADLSTYSGAESEMPKMEMEVTDVQIDGDTATCAVKATISMSRESESQSGTCYFEKQDGKWYIMNIQ